VRDGQVEVGVVRACLLERMIDEGKIEAGILRVISPLQHENFDCQTSTRLYPDWPLAKLRHTPESLAKQVARALLALPADSEAARAGNYGGFTIAMDYQPVHDLFRELKIPPYSGIGHTSLQQLWERYWQWAVFLIVALLWGAWHMARVEHMVAVRTDQLSSANARLKQEMDERQKAERRALMRQAELAHVSRISAVGELASGMAHELNQPLSAINSYAQGSAWRLQAGEMNTDELIEIHQQIAAQAERAGTIIQRFRDFLRKEDVACTEVDVNRAIDEALQLFAGEVRRYELDIERHLAPRLPPICAEVIQVEQVILNLLRNAAEAMQPVEDRPHRLLVRSEERADGVWMCVSDNGPGMSAQVADHLFDPFFTTKADGMGLGLSISQSIIEAQGGRLELEKNDSDGVTLSISWPAYRGAALNGH
jgi:two-component system sensor histidine kinase TtrS